jgi:hypothetical protein
MQFSLPNEAVLDMSESYINFDFSIDPTGRVNEVQEVYLVTVYNNASIANFGQFQLSFDGENSRPLAYNATATDVYNALLGMSRLVGNGYAIGVSGTTVLTTGVLIYFGNFDVEGQPPSYISYLSVVSNSCAVLTGPSTIPCATGCVLVTEGVLSQPRLEKFMPTFDNIYIQLNNETIYNLQEAQVLENILVSLEPQFSFQERYFLNATNEYGLGFNAVSITNALPGAPVIVNNIWYNRGLRFSLSNIDLFKHILPLQILKNPQFRIYMHVDSASRVLICSNSSNNTNQAFSMLTPKLHYHKLILPNQEVSALIDQKNSSGGLIIPYRGWANFKTPVAIGTSNLNAIFNPSQSALLGIYFVMYSLDYAANATNYKKLSTFLMNNIDNYRLKVGSQYFPLDAIRSSSNFPSNAEIIEELNNFTELVKYRPINGDLTNMWGFTIGRYNLKGTNPTDFTYVPFFENTTTQATIFAVSTSDLGYDANNRLCSALALNGVDARALANVQLELNGMTVSTNCQLEIFYLFQNYLVFQGDTFAWKH